MQDALKEVEGIVQQQYHYGGTNDGGAICTTHKDLGTIPVIS